MRSLWIVLVAAGCGFNASTGGTGDPNIDAANVDAAVDAPADRTIDAAIDAPVVIDAPIDAAIDAPPPMWTVVETLPVSCLNVASTSTFVLLAGVTYRLQASGNCVANTANGSRGDAEYVGYNINNLLDTAGGIDTGIAVNDLTPGSTKNPRWGAYTATHEYEVMWLGTGTTITANVHADNYSNNSGSLTLKILALQ